MEDEGENIGKFRFSRNDILPTGTLLAKNDPEWVIMILFLGLNLFNRACHVRHCLSPPLPVLQLT